MLGGDVVNKLLNQNRLADARASEKTRLTASGVRRDQVDDLDTRFEDLRRRVLFFKCRRGTMDRPRLFVSDRLGIVIDRVAKHVEHAPEALGTDRHLDRRTRILRLHTAHESVRRAHGDAARDAVTKVLHDFDDQVDVEIAGLALDLDGVQDLRQLTQRKLNIDDSSDDLYYFSFCQW